MSGRPVIAVEWNEVMQSGESNERRRYQRFGVDWMVHEIRPGRSSYRVVDFGAGGVKLDKPLQHPVGTLLVLMFELHDPLKSFVAPARVLEPDASKAESRLEFLMPQYHLSRELAEKIN